MDGETEQLKAERPWVECAHCENPWCTLHLKHAFECDCPPLDGDPED